MAASVKRQIGRRGFTDDEEELLRVRYIPSPEDIQRGLKELQDTWDDAERAKRLVGYDPKRDSVVEVKRATVPRGLSLPMEE